MNIYFFIKDVSLTGGTERVTVNLASLFTSKNFPVTIVSYYQGKSNLTYVPQAKVKTIFLVKGRCPDEGRFFTRIKYFFKAVLATRKFFHEKNINNSDVIISQNFFSNVLIWLAGKAPMSIGCEHFKYDVYCGIIRMIRNLIYRRFKRIVALTEKDRLRFEKHLGDNKTATIANMVSSEENVKVDATSESFIAVGRLAPQKGFDMLIDAMKIVVSKYPSWKLNIWGEGEAKDFLQMKIQHNELCENVKLNGYTNNLVNEFKNNAFFVMSSRYEGFPLVLVEALGYGVPSLSFDCPEGPAILLENGGGMLLPFNCNCDSEFSQGYKDNVSVLADGIIYMIEHPKFRKECELHRDVIKRQLSPDVIYGKWKNLLNL